ncbi:unnamed protein product, partial [Dibothriocephalus latus]
PDKSTTSEEATVLKITSDVQPQTPPTPQPPASIYSLETSADHMFEAPSVDGPPSAAPPSQPSSSSSSSSVANPLPTQKDRPDQSVRFALEEEKDD